MFFVIFVCNFLTINESVRSASQDAGLDGKIWTAVNVDLNQIREFGSSQSS